MFSLVRRLISQGYRETLNRPLARRVKNQIQTPASLLPLLGDEDYHLLRGKRCMHGGGGTDHDKY